MSVAHETVNVYVLEGRRSGSRTRGRWRRTLLASTAALSLMQNAAWALCADGTTFPATTGFVIGVAPAPSVAANWSPNVFTGTLGSLFIPDTSVNEHNNPAQPLTGGGHNWVFDQGSTLCKETDTGPAGAIATRWAIPPTFSSDCVVLPVIKGTLAVNVGDIPGQSDVITPTCDPTKLSTNGPNPANTYFNQLGCSISHGVATTPQTATSFLFVAGIKGGLFSIALTDVPTPLSGGEAGKMAGSANYYSAIPSGSKLTNAAVSKDGQFAIATSNKRSQAVFACLNPLGDPGDAKGPISPNFFVPQASAVKCMVVGNNNMAVDLTTAFGPDNQPYFAGQSPANKLVNTFNGKPGVPGGAFAAAWPQCIYNGAGIPAGTPLAAALATVFNGHSGGHCGNAQPNAAFPVSSLGQTTALISHGSYMYAGTIGGPIVQTKVTVSPTTGLSQYSQLRTYLASGAPITGLGVADDLKSLMAFSDPSGIGAAGQEVVTKLPLCEDITP